ncbi:hypothetical protein DYG74_13375 [Yersinia enterocolitica]|nr:hypothetical protein [Yersinia enterocolitica]EKN5029983.1 hypothetical protein [Yersinia enterocolitica]EKN5077050.1 hypothetical protein [Yersinia enterocolitica]EKN5944914.1 hypothetical protein [Yersinia enterocolitica]EKN5952572.1 hypothetical protein [Yersinia enterocolitica]
MGSAIDMNNKYRQTFLSQSEMRVEGIYLENKINIDCAGFFAVINHTGISLTPLDRGVYLLFGVRLN